MTLHAFATRQAVAFRPVFAGGDPHPVFLQSGSLATRLAEGAAQVLGLALLAAGLAAAVALVYRWYARERVPGGLAALVGLSGVAVYLNSTAALREVIGNTGDPLDETVALFNIVTVLVSLFAARAGTDVGDHVGTDVFDTGGVGEVETEVNRIVQAVGRVITVELPGEIDDIVGYDPVPDETKAALAGRSFVFPRRLTVAELRDRLVTRLKADYAVGHVDIDLADDGTVEYLALGSRAAGIGPTLPPETSAVAIKADPALAASAGDLVQVWRTDPMERVLTAELRGKVDDVVTLAVDAADTRRLADDAVYKLVTLPVETRPDREFASILRTAEETMAAVTVDGDSPLAGQPVGALDVTVVAIRPADGPVEALPGSDRRLAAGDSVYLVATPDAIRKVEGSLRPDDAAVSPGSTMPPDERVDAATPVAGGSSDTTRGSANTAVGSGASRTGGDDASPADDGDASPAEEDDALDLGEGDLSDLDGGDGSTGSGESANADGDRPIDDVESGTPDGEDESDPLSDWKTLGDAESTRDELTDSPGTDPDEQMGGDVDELSDAGATDADEAATDADDGKVDDGKADDGTGETASGEEIGGPDDDVAPVTDESGSDDEGPRDE